MIMHGTWYKGPQLAHHTDYSQFRSYPSFVVTPYHQPHHPDAESSSSVSLINANNPPVLIEETFSGANQLPAQLTSDLSSTIKIEQGFSEATPPLGVEEYGINLNCSVDTFRKPAGYAWPITSAEFGSGANNTSISVSSSPPTPTPSETNDNLAKGHPTHFEKYESHLKSPREIDATVSSSALEPVQLTTSTPKTISGTVQRNNIKTHTHGALQQNSTMPIGGVQSQNPTQGLVHWMSAVMAEHMSSGQTHHDPTGIGNMHMHMWNGNVDCGQHSKEIGEYNNWPPTPRNHMQMKQGYEAKMSDHHSNLQKGHFLDDNRLEHHQVVGPQGSGLMGPSMVGNSNGGGLHHGNHLGGHHGSATTSSAALLVVPHPINASKIGASLGGGGTVGTGRKYQCKMCPQNETSKH